MGVPAFVVSCGLLALWGPEEMDASVWTRIQTADVIRRGAPSAIGADEAYEVPSSAAAIFSADASEFDRLRTAAGWRDVVRTMISHGLDPELVEEDLAPVLSDNDRMFWSYRHLFLSELQPSVRPVAESILRPIVSRYFASLAEVSTGLEAASNDLDYYVIRD